jgi:hypothetical protein
MSNPRIVENSDMITFYNCCMLGIVLLLPAEWLHYADHGANPKPKIFGWLYGNA